MCKLQFEMPMRLWVFHLTEGKGGKEGVRGPQLTRLSRKAISATRSKYIFHLAKPTPCWGLNMTLMRVEWRKAVEISAKCELRGVRVAQIPCKGCEERVFLRNCGMNRGKVGIQYECISIWERNTAWMHSIWRRHLDIIYNMHLQMNISQISLSLWTALPGIIVCLLDYQIWRSRVINIQ